MAKMDAGGKKPGKKDGKKAAAEEGARRRTAILMEKLAFVSDTLGLPPLRGMRTTPSRADEKTREIYVDFILLLESGRQINIGVAKDVLSFGKVQAAIAAEIGHVIPQREKRLWADSGGMAQMLFDIERGCRA
jgi:hypothetical protein